MVKKVCDFWSDDTVSNLVEIKDVRFSRGSRMIFNGLNFSIPRGKITAILGPSGTGKTTLVKLITGQIRPDDGVILFEGRAVLYAGSGITADSIPEKEWLETEMKCNTLLNVIRSS